MVVPPALGGEAGTTASSEFRQVETVPPPPAFLYNRPPLPDQILQDKRQGRYATGIPIIGTDPDNGIWYGAQVQWYDDGRKDSPFFYYAPYRKRITVNVGRATEGTQDYWVDYDQPYVADTPWRVRGFGGYLEHKFQRYFGIGESTLGKLSFPGLPGVSFDRAEDYFNHLSDNSNGTTFARYNAYDRRQLLFTGDLERDYLGGVLRPLVGLQISHVDARDYTGKTVNGYVEQETKLHTDFRNGSIRDFEGGWLNLARVGLTYDTRDYEPDPTSGVLGQLLAEGSMQWMGADSRWGHFSATGQYFYPLVLEKTRLILATNAVYSNSFGGVPFFAYPSMNAPGVYTKEGLGGFRTLRGFYGERFVGPVQIQGNLELRWTVGSFTILNQNLRPMFVPFLDLGRVFDKSDRFSFDKWQPTGGLAFRLAWNVATIVSFDLGFSREGYGFYMETGHPF